jgi:prepilin-type N-terminal cleavage/methylation domain-containing protein
MRGPKTKMRHGRKGFTLIELTIVLVIIGILASIAAPMISGIKAKAICAEAVAAMGTIYNALNLYYARHGQYPAIEGYMVNYPVGMNALGFSSGDLNGTYFSERCYYVYVVNTDIRDYFPEDYYLYTMPVSTYLDGLANDAARHIETEAITDNGTDEAYLYMDTTGRVYQYNISKSGFPLDPFFEQ